MKCKKRRIRIRGMNHIRSEKSVDLTLFVQNITNAITDRYSDRTHRPIYVNLISIILLLNLHTSLASSGPKIKKNQNKT